MITAQELSALAQLLNRLPMTQPEGLWVQHLMDKLGAMIQSREPKRDGEHKARDNDDS